MNGKLHQEKLTCFNIPHYYFNGTNKTVSRESRICEFSYQVHQRPTFTAFFEIAPETVEVPISYTINTVPFDKQN